MSVHDSSNYVNKDEFEFQTRLTLRQYHIIDENLYIIFRIKMKANRKQILYPVTKNIILRVSPVIDNHNNSLVEFFVYSGNLQTFVDYSCTEPDPGPRNESEPSKTLSGGRCFRWMRMSTTCITDLLCPLRAAHPFRIRPGGARRAERGLGRPDDSATRPPGR